MIGREAARDGRLYNSILTTSFSRRRRLAIHIDLSKCKFGASLPLYVHPVVRVSDEEAVEAVAPQRSQ